MWIAPLGDQTWAGDEDSFKAATALIEKVNATKPEAFLFDMDEKAPSLLQKQGNVGIISVNGPLMTSVPSWARAIFGITDYPAIREALVDAARDPDIGAIMLDVNSPGGAVTGVTDVADLVAEIDTKVKPVHAYTGQLMASAAYWISSSARRITAGNLAEVGSIGVIMRHMEYTKALEKEGVTVNVLRSGKYKALVNPVEALSDVARADAQAKLDYTYGMFMGHVASQRDKAYAVADQQMGQGRTFIGENALAAGLVDGIATFEQALAAAEEEARAFVDKRKSLINNQKKQEGSSMKRKATLTEQDIAAIASGAPVAAVEQPAAPAPEAPQAEEDTTVVDAAVEGAEPTTEAPAAETEAPAETKAEAGAQDAVVAMLRSQLAERDEAIVKLRVDLSKAQDEAAGIKATHDGLLAIARGSARKMYIALGQGGEHVDALSPAALLEEHGRVSEVFQSKFKVGGVAAAAVKQEGEGKKTVKSNPLDQARRNATRIAK